MTGKRLGAPWLQINLVAIFEMTHVKLANRGAFEAAMGFAVDHHAAHAADAFAAIVVESDGIFALGDQALVDNIEHFEERHVFVDVRARRSEPCGLYPGRSSVSRREV